jgi:hypothetical protein
MMTARVITTILRLHRPIYLLKSLARKLRESHVRCVIAQGPYSTAALNCKLHIDQFLVDALIEAVMPDAKDKGVQREPDEHPILISPTFRRRVDGKKDFE